MIKNNTYPSPWDLKYFQEMALTENLSRASERLGIGQPTLSLSLKRLETQLGVTLFFRKSKGLELTPAGQRLLKECNGLLLAWEAVLLETKKSQNELIGTFVIGCHQSVGIYALKKIIPQIYENFPGIEIRLVHNLSRIICERVIAGEINFGIVVNPIRHSDLIIQGLGYDEVGFWKIEKGNKDVLIYNPSLSQSHSLISELSNKNISRTITSESLEIIANLAMTGVGTAILPARVAQAIGGKNLKRVYPKLTFHDQISLVYHVDLPKTVSSKAILEIFKLSDLF